MKIAYRMWIRQSIGTVEVGIGNVSPIFLSEPNLTAYSNISGIASLAVVRKRATLFLRLPETKRESMILTKF
jgi:hypothetical protein